MTDFLLELRSEEIPARMQVKAKADLARLFAEEIAKAGLTAEAFAPGRNLASQSTWNVQRTVNVGSSAPTDTSSLTERTIASPRPVRTVGSGLAHVDGSAMPAGVLPLLTALEGGDKAAVTSVFAARPLPAGRGRARPAKSAARRRGARCGCGWGI